MILILVLVESFQKNKSHSKSFIKHAKFKTNVIKRTHFAAYMWIIAFRMANSVLAN